jgi:UrcA family protein
MSHRIALLAAAGLLAGAGLPAFAEPTSGEVVVSASLRPGVEIRRKVVAYGDLDITRSEGAQSLLGRIRGAAKEVCTPEPTHPGELREIADYDRCMHGAMDGAVAQARSPLLDDLYSRVR